MSRTADEARRAELLDRAVDYVCRHGLAELSLRPLAKAVGSSPRVLLYYFGSKENLVVEIVRRGRDRQHAMMASSSSPTVAARSRAGALARVEQTRMGAADAALPLKSTCSRCKTARVFPVISTARSTSGCDALETARMPTGAKRRDAGTPDRRLSRLLARSARDARSRAHRPRGRSLARGGSTMRRTGLVAPRRSFIFITVLIDMVTFGMIGPVLPKLIAGFVGNDYACAAEIIGLFATVWALMQFFCSPLLGMLSDRVGRRPVILISNAVTRRSTTRSWRSRRIFGGSSPAACSPASRSSNMTAASAYIADVTPPEKRAAAFGMIGSAFGLGFVLGPGDRRPGRQHQSAPDVLGGRGVRAAQHALRSLRAARVAAARAAHAAPGVEARQSRSDR